MMGTLLLLQLSLLLVTRTSGQNLFSQVFSCPGINLPNGAVTPAQQSYLHESMVTVTCNPGYELLGKDKMVCDQNLAGWDGMYPICLRKQQKCENPGLLNGIMSRRTTSGDTSEIEDVYDTDPIHSGDIVMFECDEGFVPRVVGVTQKAWYVHSLLCQEDGQWDGHIPTCEKVIEKVSCGNLTFEGGHMLREVVINDKPAMESVKPTDAVYAGQVVRFHCHFGHLMKIGEVLYHDGPTYSVECQSVGTWAGPLPSCERFQCGAPPLGRGLEVVGGIDRKFHHTDKVTYRCSGEDYELLGPDELTCRMDLSAWFPQMPTCRAKACPSVRWPEHGNLVQVNESSKQALCNEGFSLNGTEVRTCLTNGTWSGTPVACTSQDEQCPDPGHPDGGFRSMTGSGVNSELTYHCNSGFRLVGEANQVCTEPGQWSDQPVKCLGPDEYSDPKFSSEQWKQIITAIERDNSFGGNHEVFLLLDSSGSISNDELNAQRNFFGNLAIKLPRTQMTMVSFNNTARLIADRSSSAEIGEALRNNVFTSGGATEIKRALSYVRRSPANKKSVVVILNDAINQGGSLSNVLNRRWRTPDDPKPAMYIITLGGFVDREDLLRAVSHQSPYYRHLFLLRHKADLETLTLGIQGESAKGGQPEIQHLKN